MHIEDDFLDEWNATLSEFYRHTCAYRQGKSTYDSQRFRRGVALEHSSPLSLPNDFLQKEYVDLLHEHNEITENDEKKKFLEKRKIEFTIVV